MVHRGPDDEGVHTDASTGVSLGARRLSIIDLVGGHQPLSNEDGSIWAVLNGEIYNHHDLRRELRSQGHHFASGTDTEVLVHLYEQRGSAMVHALDGMFAFAIWDAPQARLMIARDRFGEKPLFYSDTGGTLSFASELTTLLKSQDSRPELDTEAMDDYFVFGYVGAPRTMCAGIHQLSPSSILTWEQGLGARLERYWCPPSGGTRAGPTRNELIEESERLLRRSVERRLAADVPVGVFLSGGIDSTLVAALAARGSGRSVKTFTVGYSVGDVSETAEARQAAVALGTDHHELVLENEDIASQVPAFLRSMDQPIADQALVALHSVAALARSEVKVAVGGEGADELFAGYPRYRWLRRAATVDRLMPTWASRALRPLAAGFQDDPSVMHRLGRIAVGGSPVELHIDWVTRGRRRLRGNLYGPRMHTVDLARVTEDVRRRVDWRSFDDPARAFMALDQVHWLPDNVLAKADRASMAVSLEVRTPFLQHELAELQARAPIETHLAGGGKAVLRELLRRAAPGLVERPKTAFRVPAGEWLRGPLAPILEEQLATSRLYTDGWFDSGPVGEMASAHARGADRSDVLWPLLTLGLWLEGLE